MNTDQLVQHIQQELDSVPPAHGSFDTVQTRGRRRRAIRRFGVAIAGAAGVIVAGIVSLSLLIPGLPRVEPPQAPGEPSEMLIDGEMRVLVTGPIGEVDSFDGTFTVYAGVAGPQASFDLEDLGVEQPFEEGVPTWDWSTSAGDVPLVYLGDVNGRSVFLHTNGTIGRLERILAWFRGETIGSHICLSYGVTDTIGGQGFCGGGWSGEDGHVVDGFLIKDGVGPAGDIVTWVGVPEGTAAVTLELSDGRRMWQRPVSDVAFFDLDGSYSGEMTLIALDTEGHILNQQERPILSPSQDLIEEEQRLPTPPAQP
jgi:hypothetical protein